MATTWMKVHVNPARLQYRDVLNADHMISVLNVQVSTLLSKMDFVFAEREVRISTLTKLQVHACVKRATT